MYLLSQARFELLTNEMQQLTSEEHTSHSGSKPHSIITIVRPISRKTYKNSTNIKRLAHLLYIFIPKKTSLRQEKNFSTFYNSLFFFF